MSVKPTAPKFVLALVAVDAPVPPSAMARSVIPVIEPPVMATLLASCVEIVPKPRFVRAPDAVLALVPPFAMATIPDTLPAVPVTLPTIGEEKVLVPPIVWLFTKSTKLEPVI